MGTRGKIVKLGGGYCPQFVKVMQRVLWGACPLLSKCPSHMHPSPSNTLLLDDSPHVCIMMPPRNVIFPRSSNPSMHIDMFLFMSLYRYVDMLVLNNLTVLEFVLPNPIYQPCLALEHGAMYKWLYNGSTNFFQVENFITFQTPMIMTVFQFAKDNFNVFSLAHP